MSEELIGSLNKQVKVIISSILKNNNSASDLFQVILMGIKNLNSLFVSCENVGFMKKIS